MSSQPAARTRTPRRWPSRAVIAATVGAVLLAACVGGAPASPGPAATPTATTAPEATGAAATGPTPTAVVVTPSPSPDAASPSAGLPPDPPVATLTGARGDPVAGALGSFTWAGGGSDSPWIVVRPDRAATGGGPWAVTLHPDVPLRSWRVSWARIRDGRPAAVAGYEEGDAGPVSFDGPDGTGPWTVRLEAWFDAGDSAVYFWRFAPGE